MVAIGTFFSAFWILSANSWMQTPAGFAINEVGQYVPEDWFRVIFNPSFPYRLVHMLLAAFLTTSFVVGGVGAWHLLRDNANESARTMFSMAMWMAAFVAPLQLLAGDLHGLNTLEHQPAKVAAMEGHFQTQSGVPLILFGLPNQETGEVDFAVEIPGLASLILTHDLDGTIQGLEEWPRDEWPNVPIVFWSFRAMVAIGFAMIGLGLWSLFARWRGRLFDWRALKRTAVLLSPTGFIAVIAGWIVTEVGRQPYTVYGLLKTADSLSPIDAPAVAGSLVAFIVVYFAVFGAGAFYLLRLMKATPHVGEAGPEPQIPTPASGLVPGPAMKGSLDTELVGRPAEILP
jgi:cytochrome d ubiquinol oxidase subunit I